MTLTDPMILADWMKIAITYTCNTFSLMGHMGFKE